MGRAGPLKEDFMLVRGEKNLFTFGWSTGRRSTPPCVCGGCDVRRAFARTGAVPQWKAVSGISTCGKIRIIVMSRSSKISTAQDQRVLVVPNEMGQ